MQLKAQTDYALRALLFLSSHSAYSTNKEMSDALGIAPNYLPKITKKLRDKGWIVSVAGINGGHRMAVTPGSITMLDVMQLMEDTVKLNRCLEPDGYCSRHATDTCQVHVIYRIYQEFSEEYFSNVTIADLMEPDGINRFYGDVLMEVIKIIREHEKIRTL